MNKTATAQFDIPRIRLSLWQRLIIFLEDIKILPPYDWVRWYDFVVILSFLLIFGLSSIVFNYFLPEGDYDSSQLSLGQSFLADVIAPSLLVLPVALLVYIFFWMPTRHFIRLENHCRDLLKEWGKSRGYTFGQTVEFSTHFNKWIGWKQGRYVYAETKTINNQSTVSIFAKLFYRPYKKPTRLLFDIKKDEEKEKTLTFTHIKPLPRGDFGEVLVVPRHLVKKAIFLKNDLKFYPNLIGVNEFDRRFLVYTSDHQKAMEFLNPIVILGLLHLSLPHEILVLGNEVLIASSRHFTRLRVVSELDSIATAIIDAHGGVIHSSSWQTALAYFQKNPYNLKYE